MPMTDFSLLGEAAYVVFYILYFSLIFSIALVIILDNRNPVKTMAWILVLFFLPVVGLVFYFFFGRSTRKERLISRKGYSRLRKRPMAEFQAQLSLPVSKDQHILMGFFRRTCNALTFEGNALAIHTDGASMLLDLIREVSKARHHIHLEFYIFENDATGRLLRDILIDKAREGVKIRVLYDDVGCWKVDRAFYEQMLFEGIDAQSFLKVRFPQFTSKVNYRNHRKIVVIDGKVGFIGGMNIADRYIKGTSWGPWRDTHVKLSGKAVYGLQTAFLTDWYVVDRTLLTGEVFYPKMREKGTVVAQIVTSDPVGEWREMMQGIMMAISSARKYFYVQTPYLLPTEQILTALQTAALAGIDVRIMIPKKADTWLTHKGSFSYLDMLMKAGVRIYLYRKGFLHSKLMVSDDRWSTVGSTNMDFRSFEHNFEANAFFYDKETALALKSIFLEDQKKCMFLVPKMWAARSWSNRFTESVVRLLAPLL